MYFQETCLLVPQCSHPDLWSPSVLLNNENSQKSIYDSNKTGSWYLVSLIKLRSYHTFFTYRWNLVFLLLLSLDLNRQTDLGNHITLVLYSVALLYPLNIIINNEIFKSPKVCTIKDLYWMNLIKISRSLSCQCHNTTH